MRYSALAILKKEVNGEPRFLTLYHVKKLEHPWRFAGGKLEPGETAMGAAAREAHEELGIEVQSLRLIGTYSSFVDGDEWTGFFYLCDQWEGEPRLMEPDKITELRWMTYNDLLNADSYPETQAVAELLGTPSQTTYGCLESWDR